jgi:hypothetical protein
MVGMTMRHVVGINCPRSARDSGELAIAAHFRSEMTELLDVWNDRSMIGAARADTSEFTCIN